MAIAAAPRREPPEVRRHKQADRRWVEQLAVAGADETLAWDAAHGLLEGTRSNVFVLRGDELSTPPVGNGLVPGVVRAELIARVGALRLAVVERSLGAIDLRECDALLLTGSGMGVVVAASCDGRAAGTPAGRARAARLRAAFAAACGSA